MTSPYLDRPLRTESQARADIAERRKREALVIASKHPMVSALVSALENGVGYAAVSDENGDLVYKEIKLDDILNVKR